ncbi:hypothetical protein EV426DRAFT_615019 [Tirmania nivea]|nr:hypothetical protein EV426DRAFT_615019 [Tirmania nivea]
MHLVKRLEYIVIAFLLSMIRQSRADTVLICSYDSKFKTISKTKPRQITTLCIHFSHVLRIVFLIQGHNDTAPYAD